ncbi:hypothetical protein D3C85_1205960 [compost metagenome]
MPTRTSRSVGNPTAAVIRLTWRFLPSRICNSTQVAGMAARKRIGGSRVQSQWGSSMMRAEAGSVRKSPRSTPARSAASAVASGTPSTWAR